MSRMTLVVIAMLMSVPSLARANAPVTATQSVQDIKAKLLYLRVGFVSTLGGIRVYRDGHKVNVGFLGGHINQIFSESPVALATAKRFRTLRIVGFSMWTVGLTTLVVDLGLVLGSLAPNNPTWLANHSLLYAGLLVGGAAVGLPGAFILEASTSRLADAVNQYNDAVLNEHLPDNDKINLRKIYLSAKPGGGSVGLAFAF